MTPPYRPEIPGFEFRTLIGSGGYSSVYLCWDENLGREVAIKILNQAGITEEARVMAALSDHAHIVDVYDTGTTDDDRVYIVMRYYSGETFAQKIRQQQIGVPDVVKLGVEMCGALASAHRRGVMHRDVKPANILTNEFGHSGLTDFGIASVRSSPSNQTGVSLPWSPPEVLEGTESDERGDVYSLAATLYTALRGLPPFVRSPGDNSDEALIARTLAGNPERIGRTDVPQSLSSLLKKCINRDPQRRVPTAEEFGRVLNEIEIELKCRQTPLEILSEKRQAKVRETLDDDPRARTLDRAKDLQGGGAAVITNVPARPLVTAGASIPDRRSMIPEPPTPAEWPVSAKETGHSTPALDSTGRRFAAVFVGTALLAVLGGLGFIVLRGGDNRPIEPLESIAPSVTSETVRPVRNLVVSRNGRNVVATWENPSGRPDDSFIWARSDPEADLTPHIVATTSAAIGTEAEGRVVCVQVAVKTVHNDSSEPVEACSKQS